MGVELLEIGIKLKKGAIFTIRGGFRSVCNHAFFVGMLCFLILLYRSSPFIFSLLVSTSPILICTAVLLGVLLSYGQPNIPEIEIEEKTTFDAVSIKTGVSLDTAAAVVVEKNDSYYVERFSEADESTEHPDSSTPLIEERSERSREIESNDGEIWDENRGLDGLRFKNKSKWIEDDESDADSFDSEKVNVDSLDSPICSPWTRVEERENQEDEEEEENGEKEQEDDENEEEEEEKEEEEDDDDDEEDDASDSDSSHAESSSPDASMADIAPMLDELHPLLEEEPSQPVNLSDVASEKSLKSIDESDDEAENQEDMEVADDENEDKEEQTKSAITWTEEDQKNLMDLGSSEIERNQRLENLIMRRKARKNMSSLAERNLIDFESSDLPFNIAPVSIRRQNPFENPHDSYYDLGLPPIPGSAPSVLLPRRNPFDIPYDSSEEKPNLVGDGFQEEFTSQPRDAFFRRHESFNVRPSVFAPNRVRMRPFFVPEGVFSEESSYSTFERQLSELSESKVSSVPETESVSSVADLEERKLSEEDNLLEVEPVTWTKEVSEENLSLDQEEEEVAEEDVNQELEMVSSKIECVSEDLSLDQEEEEVAEEDVNQELEMVSPKIECVSEDIGHGSQSSEEEEDEEDLKREVENRYNSDYSRSSSLSEVSERVFIDTEGDEGISMFDGVAEEPIISTENSAENSDFRVANTLLLVEEEEVQTREPVYDSSPRRVSRNISSSSISCDVNIESVSSIADPVDESGPVRVDTSFESSEDQNLDELREEHVIERDSGIAVVEPQVEDQLREEHIISMEETVRSPMHEPIDEHLSEVQESRTAVESSRDFLTPPKPDILDSVHELDSDTSLNVNSPLSTTFISIATNASTETTTSSHVDDVQTIVEEAVEFEEFDEELLSELDTVGDFSIKQWTSADHVETSTIRVVEPNSDEENKAEEETVYISEPQTSKTSGDEHIDISEKEFEEMDGQDSPDRETSSEENRDQLTTPTDNEDEISKVPDIDSVFERADLVTSAETVVDVGDDVIHRGQLDSVSEIAELVTSAETAVDVGNDVINRGQVDSVSEIAELVTSAETVVVAGDDVIYRGQADSVSKIAESVMAEETVIDVGDDVIYRGQADSISEKTDLMTSEETVIVDSSSTVEDIDLAFKQISDRDIGNTDIFEPTQEELLYQETITEQSENESPNTNSSLVGPTNETSILEFRQAEEDATVDYKQLNKSSTEEVHLVVGPIPSEDTNFPPKQVLDGEAMEKQEPNSDNGLVKVKADEVGSSIDLLSTKEINVVADEKTDNETIKPNETTSVKGKGKASRSSSSNSSSSSESSSSDSDKE